MKKLVLLRHGESVWNQQNRFASWTDPSLIAAERTPLRQLEPIRHCCVGDDETIRDAIAGVAARGTTATKG